MKNRIILLSGILLIIFSSCNSWLNVELNGKVEEEKLFSTEQGFKEALAGVYAKMAKTTLYSTDLSFGVLDVLGQVYDFSSITDTYQYFKIYDYNVTDTKNRIYSIWTGEYAAIATVNNILNWIDKNGGILKGNSRQQIEGETLALRAFLHFDIYRMFAPDVKKNGRIELLPYNKVFGVETPEVCSVEQYIGYVRADLEKALVLLETDPIHGIIPYKLVDSDDLEWNKDEADQYVARMNYYAVKALLARVYLAAGKEEKARTLADEVITSGKFRLVNKKESIDVAAERQDVLFSDEHIFSLRNKNIPDYSKAVHITPDSYSRIPLPISANIRELYDGLYDDARLAIWINNNTLEKYTKNNQKHFTPKIPMIRLAEMYLISAEGWLKEDKTTALERLNDLRISRSNETSKLEEITMDDITNEYRREFIGEGQLFFMYKRLNRSIPRGPGFADVQANDNIFVFPIPEEEIERGNRTQN